MQIISLIIIFATYLTYLIKYTDAVVAHHSAEGTRGPNGEHESAWVGCLNMPENNWSTDLQIETDAKSMSIMWHHGMASVGDRYGAALLERRDMRHN